MTITFDDPPLNEVVLGRTFLPRRDFLVAHFGAFWMQVRDQFPTAADVPPLLDANDALLAGEGLLLPRVWLSSSDSTRLIQLQQNRFHYNWRQSGENTAYVRFPSVQSEAVRLWDLFSQFVLENTGQALQPIGSELTYINLISIAGTADAFSIAQKALKGVGWSSDGTFLPAPTGFSYGLSFDIPGDVGTLTVNALSGKKQDTGESLLKFELTVRGKHNESSGFAEWSTTAHDFLVAAFKDLTTPDMHTAWKLRGN